MAHSFLSDRDCVFADEDEANRYWRTEQHLQAMRHEMGVLDMASRTRRQEREDEKSEARAALAQPKWFQQARCSPALSGRRVSSESRPMSAYYKSYVPDRRRFTNHYANDYVFVEKNNVQDVGARYTGLTKRVDQRPRQWRCEDQLESGKEFQRVNDEHGVSIHANRGSIDNSRDWMFDEYGVVDRYYRMNAKAQRAKYELKSIQRNMEVLKTMRKNLHI